MSQIVGTRSEFKDGAIVRIRCHQFLTYREVTINPGPRLNIVVGPNGTGKSSIVCAIAIGLGAKTSLLGRSDHLGEFVMQGCEEGFVEIELFKVGARENPVIRRTLSSSSASCKWFLNGQPSNAKDVQKVVDRTGAQIGNLCTFLPQEKVGEFSGFDAVQLLAETEKAVGGPTHYAEHLELCALQHEMGDAARQLEAKKAKVVELEAQNASLERDRKKMEERDLHEAKVKLCQKRLLWINFEEIQDEARKLKEDKEKLDSALKASAGHLEPMKELVRKATAEVGQYTKRAADAKAKLDPLMKKHAQLLEKAGKEHETADSYKEDISNLGVRAKDLEKKVAKYAKDLEANQSKLSAFDREAIRAACAELQAATKAATAEYTEFENATRSLYEAERAAQHAVKEARKQCTAVQQDAGARAKALRDGGFLANHAMRLRAWLDSQGARQGFIRNVYGPMALEVDVTDDQFAGAIENKMGNRVLFGYATECSDDYNRLRDEIRRQKLEVNVFNVEGGHLKEAKHVKTPPQLQALKAAGVLGFLEDAVGCSDAVRQVLRDHAQVDVTMLGGADLQRNFERHHANTATTLMCGGNIFNVFLNGAEGRLENKSGRKSKYQNYTPIQSRHCQSSRFLHIKEEKHDTKAAEDALAAAEAKFEEARAAHEGKSAKQAKLKAVRDTAAKAFEEKKRALNADKVLRSNVKASEEKLAAAEAELKSVDVEKERKVLSKKISLSLEKKVKYLEEAQGEASAIMDCDLQLCCARLSLEMAKDLELCRKREVAREESDLEAKKIAVEEAKQAFKATKELLKAACRDAELGAPIAESDGAGGERATPLLHEMESLPKTRPEVVAILETEQQAAASIHHNPAVIQKYNERKAEIEDLKALIEEQEGSGGSKAAKFEAQKRAWEEKTEQCCAKLNVLFSDYMSQLGNRGMVEVKKDPDYYDRWGINLLVSFRSDGALVPLKKSVQSGGERSVSTIMFLMALQDMVKSPFRVVDEINQGMDERNERLVFKRIVENSVGSARPQYFLITPKLLQGLTAMDHEDVTVLFVFNGPYNLAPNLWNLGAFYERAAARGSGASASSKHALTQDPKRRRPAQIEQ